MDKRDLRHLKRKELIDLIDKMQTENDLVSNEEVKEELNRLKEREKYLKHLRKTLSVLVVVAAISVLVATLWMPVLKIYGSSMNPTLENGKAITETYVDSESLGNTDSDFPHQVEDSRWFCMGDNRESSIDSRSAAIGDISKEQIEGKVLFSVWPLNKIGIVK